MRASEATASSLSGRTVAIVHPAWHSCGTYAVVLAQVAAYRRLDARVVTVACSDQPGFVSPGSGSRRRYAALTPELDNTQRLFAGAPTRSLLAPRFAQEALWPYLHLDQAAIRVGMADASIVVGEMPHDVGLVHCNHFFCMPVARRWFPDRPIIAETHDLQADQFALLNEKHRFFLRPRATRDGMLRRELAQLSLADALVHLNEDEHQTFASMLPDAKHELIYPSIAEMPLAHGDGVILVASNNPANAADVLWLLREVLPLTGGLPLKIVGTVDRAIAAADPELHRKYANLFVGRVDRLEPIYESAKVILLPSRKGHGLSIKTLEALSSGAQVIATTHAFRGLPGAIADGTNVQIADTALEFAKRAVQAWHAPTCKVEATKAREAYSARFGGLSYAQQIGALARSLLTTQTETALCSLA